MQLAEEAAPLESQCLLKEELEEYVTIRCVAIAENLMDPKFVYVCREYPTTMC
jgi:hypothetical protein